MKTCLFLLLCKLLQSRWRIQAFGWDTLPRKDVPVPWFRSSSSLKSSELQNPSSETSPEKNKKDELEPLLKYLDSNIGPMTDNARRVFHGRGGLFPGCEHITLDWFPPVWLLTSYNIELDSEYLRTIQEKLVSRIGSGNSINLVYQFRSNTNATSITLGGTVPDPHVVSENGMKFFVRLDKAKNHGIFLDMANGREWVRKEAKGKSVLNLFSYTCGLSVAALMGGATSVVNMDMVRGVLKTGQRNHELNNLTAEGLPQARFFAHDIFKSWGKIRKLGPYDIIVVDPPSFQKNSFVAKKDYGKIIRRLPGLLNSEGQVMLCLNAPELDSKWLSDLVLQEAPELSLLRRLENPKDFASRDPERSLKVLLYRLKDSSLL